MATPWYIAQPHREIIDFDLTDEGVLARCEEKCRADATFKPMDEWKADFVKA